MKRTFIIAAAALVFIDLAFMRRWERILGERSGHLDRVAVDIRERLDGIGERESRLAERESIAAAMFEALADARLAILATVQNLENDDEVQD